MIENFILVEKTAESNDHVLAGDTRREDSRQCDLGGARDLPPGLSCCPIRGNLSVLIARVIFVSKIENVPHACSVCAHDRGT